MVLLITASLVLMAGLVVDGGRKVAAAVQAQSVAEGAARAGLNAAAAERLAGRGVGAAAATRAARTFLTSQTEVSGSVQLVAGGRLRVTTSSSRPTVYLAAIGIGTVTGRGSTEAALVGTGDRP